MAEASENESIEHGPPRHPRPFPQNRRDTAVRRAIAAFVPSGNHEQIAALFNNRVAINTIRQWRAGRRKMPRWAWDMLKARAAPIDEIEIGVGREVSKYNLPIFKEKARIERA